MQLIKKDQFGSCVENGIEEERGRGRELRKLS